MGAPVQTGTHWQYRGLALVFVIGVALALWIWLERQQRVDGDPSLHASTQVDQESGVRHPDFRGEWKLDLKASESVAPILKAAGKSRMTMLLADQIATTHVIRGDLRRLTILIKTPVKDQTQEMPLDGTPTPSTGPDGAETTASTRWSEDGQSLITTTEPSSSQPMRFRIIRSLAEDRRTMFLDLECRGKDDELIRVRRVFRLMALQPKEE